MASILRAVFAYFFLLLTVRAIARRPGAQMTPFEFVLIFFIGGISIQAVVADDRSLTNAFCDVTTVAMMHVLVTKLKQRFPTFGRIVDGTPVLIFEKGHWNRDRMRHHGVEEQDVMAAARGSGLEREEQIKYAVIERNGEISIVKAEQQ
jgi:uncharacterized membrane protein YcaP (DUF421 family)